MLRDDVHDFNESLCGTKQLLRPASEVKRTSDLKVRKYRLSALSRNQNSDIVMLLGMSLKTVEYYNKKHYRLYTSENTLNQTNKLCPFFGCGQEGH